MSDTGVTVSGGGLTPSTVLSRNSPAMLCYERPATDKEPGLTVVVPTPGHGDFSSSPGGGTTRKTDGFTDPNPPKGRIKPPPPGATEADMPAHITRPAQKREGVCAFIDERIMEGGRTAEEVLAIVMEKFPGRDPKATLATVKTRPSHIKAKGLVPPPFKK